MNALLNYPGAVVANTYTNGCARFGIQSAEGCHGDAEYTAIPESCHVPDTDGPMRSNALHTRRGGDGFIHQREADSDSDDRRRIVRRECELPTSEGNGGGWGDFGGRTQEYGCWEWWPAEPDVGRVADGLSCWLDEPAGVPRIAKGIKDRVDRLKCLGNAVVPQQFYPIFDAIARLEETDVRT